MKIAAIAESITKTETLQMLNSHRLLDLAQIWNPFADHPLPQAISLNASNHLN